MRLFYKLFTSGYCRSIKKLALKKSPWQCCSFPAGFSYICHPEYGNILYDAGYSERFFTETGPFPFRLYRWLTPVTLLNLDTMEAKLKTISIKPEDIDYIIISHFHADHIGCLRDCVNAKFIYFEHAYQAVKNLKGFRALFSGFLKNLLPDDFEERSVVIDKTKIVTLDKKLYPFDIGYSIFPDNSLMAVELPGHAKGQLGLIFESIDGKTIFLVADACWSRQSYIENELPHSITTFITNDNIAYKNTLNKLNTLHNLNKTIDIIPSHCETIFNKD